MQSMFLFIPCILTLFSGQCYYDYFVHLLCLDAWWLFSMPFYACLDLFLFEDVDSSVLCCTYVSFWINISMQMCCLLHACFLHFLSCGLICCVTQFFYLSSHPLIPSVYQHPGKGLIFLLFKIPFISDPFHRLWRVSTVVNVEENIYSFFFFFKGMYICVTKLWVILPPDHHGFLIFFFLSWILFFLLFEQIERQKKNIYFSLQFTVHIAI